MFKRLVLILVVGLSISGLDHAKAVDYRAYANSYLKSAVTYALDAYKTAKSSGSNAPYLAYLYSLQAKYNGQISAWLAKFGNTTITDIYNRLSYQLSSYALTNARQTYLDSTAANKLSAYYSYYYTYFANLYSYYAYLYK